MRDVYILGVGQSMFGKQPNFSAPELGAVAAEAAIQDAGIDPRMIQVAYGSRVVDASQTIEDIMKRVGITTLEMHNAENACASGGTALHMLWKDIAGGFYDIGIVVGAEAMTTSSIAGGLVPLAKDDLNGRLGVTNPSLAALTAHRLMETQGLTLEDLAYASVKNHKNACFNPYAHYKVELTVQDVLNSKMISDPITRLMCCPQSDGAAAAIVCTKEIASRYTTKPVKIQASVVLTAPYEAYDEELTDATLIGLLADKTYQKAGIGPEDLDVVELHDAFSPEEIYAYECMKLCKKGETMSFIRSGAAEINGRCPVNPSGGLQSLGHPLGASGVRVICEVTLQLRGQAGKRQVKDAKVGLAQMVGGSLVNLSSPAVGSLHVLTV
ncbi:MAG: thiolase family protein [Acidobacteria bacterium]|nr:thiolase family protein [Acidobacteriota bacterium]